MRRSPTVLALGAAALAMAACGSSSSATGNDGVGSRSALGIFRATRTATERTTSARIFGTVHSGGQTVTVDLRVDNQANGQGTLSLSGVSFQIRKVGTTVYALGNPAFTEQVGAANVPPGRWLQTTTSNPEFAGVAQLFDLSQVLQNFFGQVDTSRLIKGATSTVRGQPVVKVSSANGGTIFVATSGPAYLLQASGSAGGNSGTLDFADFNQHLSVTSPPNPVSILQSGSGR